MLAEPKGKKGFLLFPDKYSVNGRLSQLSRCKGTDFSLTIAALTYISSYIKDLQSTFCWELNMVADPDFQVIVDLLNKSVFFLKKKKKKMAVYLFSPRNSVSKEYACNEDCSSVPG